MTLYSKAVKKILLASKQVRQQKGPYYEKWLNGVNAYRTREGLPLLKRKSK